MARVEAGKEIRVVAAAESAMAGYASIKRDEGGLSHRRWLGVLVRREFRGLGLGLELARAALEEAGAGGLELVLLETSSLNERATRMFEKAGFRVVSRIPKGSRTDGSRADTLVMAAEL